VYVLLINEKNNMAASPDIKHMYYYLREVARCVEALRCKSEGRGFDSRLSLEFLIDIIKKRKRKYVTLQIVGIIRLKVPYVLL
jgi:hypothetical protein